MRLHARQTRIAGPLPRERLVVNMPEFAQAFACKVGQPDGEPEALPVW